MKQETHEDIFIIIRRYNTLLEQHRPVGLWPARLSHGLGGSRGGRCGERSLSPPRCVLPENADGDAGHTHDESFFLSSNCLSTARDRAWRKPSTVMVGAWKDRQHCECSRPRRGHPAAPAPPPPSPPPRAQAPPRWQGGPARELDVPARGEQTHGRLLPLPQEPVALET